MWHTVFGEWFRLYLAADHQGTQQNFLGPWQQQVGDNLVKWNEFVVKACGKLDNQQDSIKAEPQYKQCGLAVKSMYN
jgi:hypothetical protein